MSTARGLLPDHRPRMDEAEVRALIDRMTRDPKHGVADPGWFLTWHPVRLVGVRGYFRDSLGKPKVNDLGYYDDAIAIVTDHYMTTWNANVDPVKAGYNPGVNKLYAQLAAPQLCMFRQGRHKTTPNRLRQMTDEEAIARGMPSFFVPDWPQGLGMFDVLRITSDGHGEHDVGYHAINVHEGGHGTSSWGCQTIPVEQAHGSTGFFATLYSLMALFNLRGQTVIPYFFTDERLK